MTANALGKLVGQVVGEYDQRGRWHFRSYRKGCYYERDGDCCVVCLGRLLHYDLKLADEIRRGDHDPYPDAPRPSGDTDGRTTETVEDSEGQR